MSGGGQDPEISQISLSTNFLRGRTSRIRPPGPQKSGPDPRKPEKSGPDPRFPGFRGPDPRFPGFRGPDPRKPGIPAEMDQISRKRPFSRVPGGVGKSRKQPHDTRTVPENDRLQLMPPPWDLCLFAPDPPPALAFVTPGQKVRPQTRHRQAPIGGGLSYRPVMPADFKAETYVETPENGRFPGFRGSGPTFWGPRARNPGIRAFPRRWTRFLGSGSGNPGSQGQEFGNPGPKKSRTGTPLPRNCPIREPRSQGQKKTRPDPKKSHPQKKERRDTLQTPPCL